MKYGIRLAALLMALILLCGCALAADGANLPDTKPLPTAVPGRPEPPLKNPQDYYEIYVDQTDGSEELIYMMLDITNDEEALVDEHGSVTLVAQVMDERGNCVFTTYTGLMKCEYGLVMRSWTDAFGGMYVTYITERGEINTTSGRITHVDPDSELSQDLDSYWHGCLFPYTAPQVMNGMPADEWYSPAAAVSAFPAYTPPAPSATHTILISIPYHALKNNGNMLRNTDNSFKPISERPHRGDRHAPSKAAGQDS